MAIPVNPPPQLRIPKQFLGDKEVRNFIEQQNQILFQLWNRTGGEFDLVAQANENIPVSLAAQVQDLRLNVVVTPVTIDTTGFTIDTTEQTIDKTKV